MSEKNTEETSNQATGAGGGTASVANDAASKAKQIGDWQKANDDSKDLAGHWKKKLAEGIAKGKADAEACEIEAAIGDAGAEAPESSPKKSKSLRGR
jgi:hypothetical protein